MLFTKKLLHFIFEESYHRGSDISGGESVGGGGDGGGSDGGGGSGGA